MYTVERIENKIVVLEDRNTKELIEEKITLFDKNIKENDILDKINNKYIKNDNKTLEVKKSIRERFSKLKE